MILPSHDARSARRRHLAKAASTDQAEAPINGDRPSGNAKVAASGHGPARP